MGNFMFYRSGFVYFKLLQCTLLYMKTTQYDDRMTTFVFQKTSCVAKLREVRFKKDNFIFIIANSVEFDLRHVREFRKILPTLLKAIFKFFLKSKNLK